MLDFSPAFQTMLRYTNRDLSRRDYGNITHPWVKLNPISFPDLDWVPVIPKTWGNSADFSNDI